MLAFPEQHQEHQLENRTNGRPLAPLDAGDYLLEKIRTRRANVAIIGLGYVGLPLAMAFATAGFPITGIDVDQKRVDMLNAGRSHVSDVPSDQIARYRANAGVSDPAQGSFRATTDYDALYDMDAVIICVPTPLSRTKDPDMSYIITAADEIARRLHHGMLIVLESTTYPGTTEEIVLPRLQRVKVDRASLAVGEDFFLAFSPERIDPGRTDWTVRTTPKVIGGITPHCLLMAQTLYECAINTIVPVSKTTTAEMVKLLENTFRAVNIALINEVAIMCDRLDVDVWEVVEAAKTKPFGYMPFYPGPGLGGHCIPIDPRYLAWKMKTLNYNARFIQLAEEVNFAMPEYVVHKVGSALNDNCKSLKGSQILILGVTYKADIGDLRESPALDIMRILHEQGANVAYHDPHAHRVLIDGWSLATVELTAEVLQSADCVVITTAHSTYDWQWVVDNSRLVVDTRNVTSHVTPSAGRIVKL